MTHRASLRLLAILASMLALGGCTNPSAKKSSPQDLQALVGQQVHFEGRFDGPGKLADYIAVPGGRIFLVEQIDSGGEQLEYGSNVQVDGVLGYRDYREASVSDVSAIPAHYFIKNAKVRVIRRPDA